MLYNPKGNTHNEHTNDFTILRDAFLNNTAIALNCEVKETGQFIDVIFAQVKHGHKPILTPLAHLIPGNAFEQYALLEEISNHDCPSPKSIERLIRLYTDNMLKTLFRDLFGQEVLQQTKISKSNVAWLKNLKRDMVKLKKRYTNLMMAIMEDAQRQKKESLKPPPKYVNTEESFHEFLATKQRLTAKEYLRREHIPPSNLSAFKEVEHVLIYENKEIIYQLKKGEVWDFYDLTTITRRFAVPRLTNGVAQFHSLEKAERCLFKMIIKKGSNH